MDYVFYVVVALFTFFMVKQLFAAKGIREISTAILKQELKDRNKQYIDVRTPREFRGNKIRGFINIPLQHLDQNLSSLSKDKEVIVICQSGMRSKAACKHLKKKGFNRITNVKRGMNAWK
ncbi:MULTISPECIES: rhodanese-like domain-containing protein [Bacillaceae]|uniref:rhodanese-like domain-containing protein n=1 Tax=Bacillaceae TaxID=186817 RepID=UPI00104D2D93|nr:rhodanese-like domain-containing protein [Bacillus sp. CBEL-1]TDB49600.1 rhodanese-like domain-containing protein [Bacillus sp. CBEL-1]